MGTMRTGYSSPRFRASDADRDAVLAQLTDSFQAGRLTSDEFGDRSGQALAARTVGELDALMTDLPATPLAGPGPAAGPAPVAGPVPGYLPEPAAMAPAARTRSALVPLLAIIVGVAIIGGALSGPGHHHAWDVWWVIPVALIIVRRVTRRRRPGAGDFEHRGPEARDW